MSMLFTLFDNPLLFFFELASLVVAISIHEFAHAYAADHLGDPTPRLQKRVTLNPAAHIDPYGMLFMLFAGFGWGRPVQFDPFNLKNPRKDAAIISFAGPLSNLILAAVLALISRFIPSALPYLIIFIWMNISLAVFNMLPIHPLDGFKIVGGLLSGEQSKEWYKLERYGYIFLLALILPMGNSSMLSNFLRPVINFIVSLLIPAPLLG